MKTNSLRSLAEAIADFWSGYVDPREDYFDEDGSRWLSLADVSKGGGGFASINESQLAEIRGQCRALAMHNEFAINGHENRISYVVGSGYSYATVARRGRSPSENLIHSVQDVIDEFLRINKWSRRQQEILRRKDRDGECFLRFFTSPEGRLLVRFVEPEQVATPTERLNDPATSFGVLSDRDDAETAIGYWIDGRFVDSDEIQHRKSNVDATAKRGLPLFHPVRKNLRRAEKLLRNMSVVAEIQSAIAIIRKHRTATASGLEQFVARQADYTATSSGGQVRRFSRFEPGTILDALSDTEYEFPASGIDASRYVIVLQAELRAIASRLVMPEFMLTSDASNANYSSTMVAEGPAVKMFERLQREMIDEDLDVMRRAIRTAVRAGRLPQEAFEETEIRAVPPTVASRDRLRDAQADQILLKCGVMSKETSAMRNGLDPEHERKQIAKREGQEKILRK